MWEVDNRTKYAHNHSWDRDRDGAEVWIVVVKSTFSILPDGSTTPADKQPAVCSVPEYLGAPGESSLRLDTDLIRVKPATDVVVLGHAHAPHGRPVTHLAVTLKTIAFEKTLRVSGDRYWRKTRAGVSLTSPEPFVTIPIVYERAFGGRRRSDDPMVVDVIDRNPVGTGFGDELETAGEMRAPNVEYPSELVSSVTKRPRPAGFGPLSAHWMPRRQWAGTYDAKWERDRKPLVPEDLDDRFFLSAPDDQQLRAHLVGGESIELRNMTPNGLLRFDLPKVTLGFETVFTTGEAVLHRPVLHTVIVEPDYPRVSLVWQTSLRCHARVLKLDHTRVTEKVRLNAGGQPVAG
jgi:hypothetical protein